MVGLFQKYFCNHSWQTHAKEKYEWSEFELREGTKYPFEPVYDKQEYSSITEVLICTKCGEIKIIEY